MFKLWEPLETEVEIAGIRYKVNMAFDHVMKLLELLSQPQITDGEKVYIGIYLLLGTELDFEPDKQLKIFETLIKHFVHGGDNQTEPVDLEGNVMPITKSQQHYDLTHDATYIYTSFKQAYSIDLFEEQGKLDWRHFKVLLRDLPDETTFKQIIDIRTRPYPKGKGLGEERRKLKELKRTFALPGQALDD